MLDEKSKRTLEILQKGYFSEMTNIAVKQKNEIEDESVRDILKPFAEAVKRVHFPETDKDGNPSILRFYLDNGRLPHITDEIKPWYYCGWMIPYVQICELHPNIPARWHYLNEIFDAGKLIDKPIPQIHFCDEGSPQAREGLKMISKLLEPIEYRSMTWNAFTDFCKWLGYALGVSKEKSDLSDKIQEQLYRGFDVSKWLLHPTDYLGQFLSETRGNGFNPNAFYPTPMCIVRLMCEMVDGKTGDARYQRTYDPCIGTGRMPLVMSNYSLRLAGQDIDWLCVLITKINFALFAPWGVCPIPDEWFSEFEPVAPKEKTITEKPVEMPKTAEKEEQKIYRTDSGQGLLFKL